MRRNILIIAVIFGSLISCSKDNDTADSKIYFNGITIMDEMANMLSDPDTTDWTFDDEWTTKEEELFTNQYQSSNQEYSTKIIVYPNPFQDIFNIHLNNLPNSSRMEIRLVSKDFKILVKNDSIYSSIVIRPSDIAGYDTLRLYYKLIDLSNSELRGHGDILINNN
jgi:hypothetical protein